MAAGRSGSGGGRRLQVGGSCSERDLERHRLVAALDLDGHPAARGVLAQRRVEGVLLVDHLAVDAQDDVAVLQATLVGRAVRLDRGPLRSVGCRARAKERAVLDRQVVLLGERTVTGS